MFVLFRRVGVTMLAITAATTVGSAGIAGAATTHQPPATQHPAAHRSAAGGLSPDKARHFDGAGYFSHPAAEDGSVSSVSATFALPTLNCTSDANPEVLLPGIYVLDTDGFLSNWVEADSFCFQGVTYFDTYVCMQDGFDCNEQHLGMAPGDMIRASLSETDTGTIATVHDVTAGTTLRETGPQAPTENAVFVGLARPDGSTESRIPTFKPMTFDNVFVNGQYLSDWNPAHRNLVTTGTVVQARPSVVSASGLSFTTAFVHH